jgi:hypothetical protein
MKDSKVLEYIRYLYKMGGLDYNTTFKKTKQLLSIYRSVCWETSIRANEFYEQLELENKRLDVALDFLMDYSCQMDKKRFMSRVSSFFRTKWLVDLITEAQSHVYNYPFNGRLYQDIISSLYMNTLTYTEQEMLDVLNLERTNYYAKKKEAIALVGYCIWGVVIPKYQKELSYNRIDTADPEKSACEAILA